MIVVLFGVSGTGKSTVGRALARRLGWSFLDADDYHPEANIRKMSAGIPLNDTDRRPWLDTLREELKGLIERRESAVLACSALKQAYRERLDPDPANVRFVHLAGDLELIEARMRQRADHFMPAALLRSQLADLEPCPECLAVSVAPSPEDIEARICTELGLDRRLRATTLAGGLMFPEAPRWRDGLLWLTDQHARRVMTASPGGELSEVARTPDLPGGLGWLPDGSALVVLMTQRRVCRIHSGRLEDYADLSDLASFHCNDMLVDASGRAWVGNFGYDLHGGEAVAPAEVIRIDPDRRCRVAATGLIFPNGMAQAPDGGLIVAETFAARLTRFDIDSRGLLVNPRTWADLRGAFPDGICPAGDGTLWVAAPNIGEVIQVAPGGRILARIETRGRPYACALGGREGGTLYITTSETDDPEQARERRSGRIEVCEVGETAEE